MSETHVGFLYNAANCLLQTQSNHTKTLLRSYFLMRCDEISKSAALPNRYFSAKVRCPYCCIEWSKGTGIKVTPRKFSKQQRRRLRLKAVKTKDSSLLKQLSFNKELEQICSFCNHNTKTPLAKLDRVKSHEVSSKIPGPKEDTKEKLQSVKNKNVSNKSVKKTPSTNVYANSKDVFSLQNNDNTLKTIVKEQAKVIKNNKKKKDKFAGLCQKAVLATAKLKETTAKLVEEQKPQNKLNLFLKPST